MVAASTVEADRPELLYVTYH